MKNKRSIVMLGTDTGTMGGIASVVKVYRAAGLFDRFSIIYLATHCDGSAAKKLALMLASWCSLLGLLVRGRVGLVHCHMASRSSCWRKMGFIFLAKLFRIPVILHLHGAEFAIFYQQEMGRLRQRLIRGLFDQVSCVVVLSSAWKTWVESISRNPQIEAIYNPVMVPSAAQDWLLRVSGEVLFLGRLGKRKGSYDLLNAVSRMSVHRPCLLLGGDGEVEQTRAMADTLGMGTNVQLLGWVDLPARTALLNRAKVYCLPSYNEGLPMSVLEAMAAGLPVISTPVGGIPEALSDGVEGFLVEPGDIDALGDRIERLLSDDALASRMGMAARAKIQSTFSSEAVMPRVERLYAQFGFLPT